MSTAPSPLTADYAVSITSPIGVRGDADALLRALVAPLVQIDTDVTALLAAGEALWDAAGATLDWLGAQIGEPRAGLGDDEYRRIIAGRRTVLRGSAMTASGILRVIRALSGTEDADVINTGPGRWVGEGRLEAAPTTTWVARAGSVLRAAAPAGSAWSVTFSAPGTAMFDELPGFEAGTFGFDVGA